MVRQVLERVRGRVRGLICQHLGGLESSSSPSRPAIMERRSQNQVMQYPARMKWRNARTSYRGAKEGDTQAHKQLAAQQWAEFPALWSTTVNTSLPDLWCTTLVILSSLAGPGDYVKVEHTDRRIKVVC